VRLGGVQGWCPRAPPKTGVPREQEGSPGGARGGSQAGGKAGGDYPPHMDAIPKGPPVPPTPDILSLLSCRGISDLSVVAVSPHRALRRRQRHRISSRRPHSLLVFGGDRHVPTKLLRTSSPLSPTCLDPLRLLYPTVEGSSISHPFNILETRRRARGSSVAAGSETILSVASLTWHLNTTTLIVRQKEREFFTHRVFIPRQHVFDAYFTTADQRRVGRSLRLTAVIFRIDRYIDRLRPQTPNSKVQPKTKPRKQCRAALPRGLCKVSDFRYLFIDTYDASMRFDFYACCDNIRGHQWFLLEIAHIQCRRNNMRQCYITNSTIYNTIYNTKY